jgi:DNA-binding MarR family transcriptional regulator
MGVLYFLSKNEGKELIQQDIANLLNKTKSAALRTINILEEKKYLKRTTSPEDMRKNIIQLTPEGRRIIVKMHKKFLELDLNLNNNITKQEADMCKKVLLNIQEKCN